MLTIRKDPHGLTGQSRHEWDYTKTIQNNIAAHMPHGGDSLLIVNGHTVDPLKCADLDRCPTIADFVTVISRPGALPIYAWVLIAVATAVVTYALMPKIPGVQVGKDSPNNALTAQTNRARAYQALPDVYGTRRVWPDLIQPSVIEYIDHVKYITETMVISRGYGDVANVNFADSPLDDVTGAAYEMFYPSAGAGYPEDRSTVINDVVETFAAPDVDGQEIKDIAEQYSQSGTYEYSTATEQWTFTFTDGAQWDFVKEAGTYEVFGIDISFSSTSLYNFRAELVSWSVVSGNFIPVFHLGDTPAMDLSDTGDIIIGLKTIGPFSLPIECSQIRWNTVFLRGLQGSVVIEARWWQVDGSGVEISGTRETQSITFTSATNDQQFFTNNATPTAGLGMYRVQFTRVTPGLGNGADTAKLEALYAVRTYAAKTFPGVTAFRVTTRATQEATGFRDRKYNCRFSRHVRTLTSDTLSASSNFARIMAHIWTIAGNDIAELDTTALQAINTELGETSALLRYDGSLDDADMSLGERLQTVASHARCVVWRDGTQWTVTRDQARAYPSIQLDYRNLAGGGDSVISVAAHLPESRDGVEVEYVNETTQATKAYIRLSTATGAAVVGTASNPLKVKLPGCTNTAQATNRAYLEANKLIYQRTSVTDEVLSDGGIIGPGSLVRWVDPNDFYGDDGLQAGEVLAISVTTITTSESLHWGAETSGRMLFTGIDGATVGPIVVTPGATDYKAVLASAPTELYTAGSGAQLGSRYVFGPGLSEAEIESAGLYTVTGIKPASGGKAYTLELAQYDARIYAAD